MPLTRRRFLAASAAAPLVGVPWLRSFAAGEVRDKVRLGVIGVADRGAANLAGVASEEIVALCEVDEPRAAKARQQFKNAKFFTDYRKMFDAVGKEIDAVVVSTPDHTHAHATLQAMRLGKHAYCEKPLAKSVGEARLMQAVAAEKKLVTQMGTQIHAGDNYRRVVEVVQSGVLGTISEVKVWCSNRPFPGKKADAPVPGLKFSLDQWLGPVPAEFFYANHANWPHFNWRWWWEFGGGVLQDMGCHFLDLAFWALGLTAPTTVRAKGIPVKEGDAGMPAELAVDYTFPRAGQPDLKVTWHHGNPGPFLSTDENPTKHAGFGNGVAFVGDGKTLVADYGKYRLLPDGFAKDFKAPPASLAKSVGHHREWLDAIRGQGKTTCPFGYSGPLTETVLLGNVAYRTGDALTWDSAAMKAAGSKGAAALLTPPTRKGWELA